MSWLLFVTLVNVWLSSAVAGIIFINVLIAMLNFRYEKLRENAVEDYGRFVFRDYAAWLRSDKVLNQSRELHRANERFQQSSRDGGSTSDAK